ncbi:MAG: Spy/CpxP family protein refolding chaperone [Alphaproteobacteria bacterium]|nr:Spy/CpxP family protein refolding chaperone [Alphaproteobacteria bacterium]
MSIPALARNLTFAAALAASGVALAASPGDRPMPGPGPDTMGMAPGGAPMMGGHPMMGGPHKMGHRDGGFGAMMSPMHTEGRLAFIKAELAITPDQAKAFDAFADAVRANDAKIRSEMDARRQAFLDARAKAKETGERPERPSHALPDRMAEHLDMMEKRIADMKAMQPKILALYKTLDDTQKAKADRLLMMRG